MYSLRSGSHAQILRPRLRQPLLARAAVRERRAGAFPHCVSWEGLAGAFFLGQLRSGGDALLGAQGATPPRRRAEFAERGGAGGLFARSFERGLLAGRRRADRLSGVLFLRLSGAGGFCRSARETG